MKIAHDPLPIDASAEGYKGKKTSKTTPDSTGEIDKKELRPVGHRSVELHFDFCFQQNAHGGWVRGLRYIGRGLWRAKRAYRRERRNRRHRAGSERQRQNPTADQQ